MNNYLKNEIDLVKYVFSNLITIAGIAILIICYIFNTGIFEIQSFLFTTGVTILFLGVTIGYANKTINDQLESQEFFKSQLREMENRLISYLQSQKNEPINNISKVAPQEKVKEDKSSTLTDEEKIIFEHLFDRHKAILSYVDTFDVKLASFVGLNGLILSFSMFSAEKARCYGIFLIGVLIIVSCIIFGYYIYRTRDWFIGASVKFFEDCDNFPQGLGLKKLKRQLLLDIERNQENYEARVSYFNIMVHIMIVGIVLLVGGYYV
jgi:hypothetical protein